MSARMVPTPPTETPDPPTTTPGIWQSRINWAVTIVVALVTMYLAVLEAKRPATTLQPAQAPVVAPVPAMAPPAVAPALAPADVPGEAPLPLPLAGGLLLMPFGGMGMLKRAREGLRARLRDLTQRGALVALAALCFLAVLGCSLGCGRIPTQVQADSAGLSTMLVTYYEGDAAFDAARRASRIETIVEHERISGQGWMTKPFKDGVELLTCRLAKYLTGDGGLMADVRAGLLMKAETLRVAVGKGKACPEVGR